MNTIMEVFVENTTIGRFSIGVNTWDTVLTMKQKIEKSQRIPVSKQKLYFNSKVLDDNLFLMQCKIFNKSRIFLVISPEYNLNQNNHHLPYQTKQSPTEPSNQSNQFVNPQAWPVMMRSNNNHQVLRHTEPPLLTAELVREFLMNQDSPAEINQLLQQNEQSYGEFIYTQNQLLSDISKIQSKEKIQGQYSQVMMDGRNSQVPHQNRLGQALSDSSNIQRFGLGKGKAKENIHGQYSPVMLQGSYDQVFVYTACGVWFSIGVDMWDTVLTMKQKIEKIQGIPVSKQTLYFNSKVLNDNLYIIQCNIINKSCIFLVISPEYNNDQLPYQTKQSPTQPSNRSNEFVKVFVDNTAKGTFSIGVNTWDSVLTMKQKIKKSQGIPVSRQTLYLDSKVLNDKLRIEQCKIFNNSRLFLVISPKYNPNQNNDQLPYQNKQSPREPSNRSNQFVNPQTWPVMVNDHQVLPQNEPPLLTAESVEEFLMNQDSPVMMQGRNSQLLSRNDQSLAETIYSQDRALSDISKIQSEKNFQGQYSQVMMDHRNNQVLNHNEQRSVPSNSSGDICNIQRFGLGEGKGKENIHGQYSPVMLPQTEPPLVTGDSVEEFLEYQDLQVMMPHQNEQFSVPSNSSAETIYSQDQALSDHICKIQRFGLGESDISKIIHDQSNEFVNNPQALPVMVNDQVLPQTETPLVTAESSSNSGINIQDSSVKVTSNSKKSRSLPLNVLPQTEPPLSTAESVKEFFMKNHQLLHQSGQLLGKTKSSQDQLLRDTSKIQSEQNIQDQYPTTTDPLHEKLSVLSKSTAETIQRLDQALSNSSNKTKNIIEVMPFQETRKYRIIVYSDDKVGVLREILASKNQLGEFTLPEGDYFFVNKQDVLIDDQTFEENRVASFDTLEILGRKFPVGSSRNDSLRSNSSQQLRATQDLPPVPAGNRGIKTKQSPKSVSVKRGISITPYSPERKRRKRTEFTVMVQPFKEETRKIEVNVNPDEKVEELREKLAKLKEKGEFDLPEEGYFFIHKQYVLADHHTFEKNLVALGDTIEIFRGSVTC